MSLAGGIYEIKNTVTGQRYIGRASFARARVLDHFASLRRGAHPNSHLQRSFDKYGREEFTGRILIVCAHSDLPLYERLIMAGYRSAEVEFGFNQMPPSDHSMTHSEDAKRRIRDGVSRRPNHRAPKSEEQKRKIAESLRGRPGVNRGRTFGPDVRAKMAAKKMGNQHRKGKPCSVESRVKISQSMRRYWAERQHLQTGA